jgi:uncharacterized membrane protein YkoI
MGLMEGIFDAIIHGIVSGGPGAGQKTIRINGVKSLSEAKDQARKQYPGLKVTESSSHSYLIKKK